VQHILIDRPNALQAGHWEPVNYCYGDCPQSLEQITFKTNCWIVVGVVITTLAGFAFLNPMRDRSEDDASNAFIERWLKI
jgi:hypothetical protein